MHKKAPMKGEDNISDNLMKRQTSMVLANVIQTAPLLRSVSPSLTKRCCPICCTPTRECCCAPISAARSEVRSLLSLSLPHICFSGLPWFWQGTILCLRLRWLPHNMITVKVVDRLYPDYQPHGLLTREKIRGNFLIVTTGPIREIGGRIRELLFRSRSFLCGYGGCTACRFPLWSPMSWLKFRCIPITSSARFLIRRGWRHVSEICSITSPLHWFPVELPCGVSTAQNEWHRADFCARKYLHFDSQCDIL